MRACVFPTVLGPCGLAWTERGICAVQLPAATEALTARRLTQRCGVAPGDHPSAGVAARVVRRLQRHLEGGRDPLRDIPLDLQCTPFVRSVYSAARRVGPGRTTSYAALAALAGHSGAARAVGQAMAGNPLPLLIPCHRVLAAHGDLGGFSAHGAARTKLRLLTVEGANLGPVARAGVRRLAASDEKLARVIRRVGEYRLTWNQRGDHFTALAEAIVHQQVSMKAGAAIFARVRDAVGATRALDPHRVLATGGDELRAAGLSRQKAGYLRNLADRSASGALPLERLQRLDDEQVIRALVQVRGIGRWSAEMFLMFRLGRLDVLPVDDLGLRKGAQLVYGLRQLPDGRRLHRLAERWIPFRSIATWYLWRSLEAGGL